MLLEDCNKRDPLPGSVCGLDDPRNAGRALVADPLRVMAPVPIPHKNRSVSMCGYLVNAPTGEYLTLIADLGKVVQETDAEYKHAGHLQD